MAATDYCALSDVKGSLDRTDPKDDAALTRIITTVSRQIDALANRRFYQLAETRYFTAPGGDWVEIDDLVSVTTLKTDISGTRVWDTLWAATDYDLTPDNAAGINQPYTAIRQRPFTSRWFPTIRKAVQIAGVWGWPALPSEIVDAAILQAIRIFSRKNSIYGVAGQGDFGRVQLIPRLDPDVAALVMPYVRHDVLAVV